MENLKKAEEWEKAHADLERTPEEQKRVQEAARKVRELTPVKSEHYPTDRKNAMIQYMAIGSATNKETGNQVTFYNSAFKKDFREDGLFEKAVPALKQAFEESVFAYSEPDNRAGEIRRDGTVHKEHPNTDSFDNYVGKVAIDGKDYYVRFTVASQKGQSGVHNHFVSDVTLYDAENPASGLSYPDSSLRARGTLDGVVDAKLQRFFALASGNAHDFRTALKYATGWERGADGKWRHEEMDDYLFNNGYSRLKDLPNDDVKRAEKERAKCYDKWRALYEKYAAKYGNAKWESMDWFRKPKSYRDAYHKLDPADKALESARRKRANASRKAVGKTLGDFFGKDASLFKAYPDLAGYTLRFKKDKHFVGLFNSATKEVTLNSEYLDYDTYANNSEYVCSVLAHEIQHAIQQAEGFAEGGTPSVAQVLLPEYLRDICKRLGSIEDTMFDIESTSPYFSHFEQYPYSKSFKPNSGLAEARKKLALENKKYAELLKQYKPLKDARDALDVLNAIGTPHQKYEHLAGEVEARNVQTRMNKDAEERRGTLAEDTEEKSMSRGTQIIATKAEMARLLRAAGYNVSYALERELSGIVDSAEDVRHSVASGVEALRKIAEGEEHVENAMTREDLVPYGGTAGITFDWGTPGNPQKGYKGGFGVSHILSKHGPGTLAHVIDVIANGKVVRYVEGNRTVVVGKDGYEAVLSLTRNGKKDSWLLTGWNIDREKERTDVHGEVSAQSMPTQTNPIFSREDLGAALSSAKIQQIFEKASSDVSGVVTEKNRAKRQKERESHLQKRHSLSAPDLLSTARANLPERERREIDREVAREFARGLKTGAVRDVEDIRREAVSKRLSDLAGKDFADFSEDDITAWERLRESMQAQDPGGEGVTDSEMRDLLGRSNTKHSVVGRDQKDIWSDERLGLHERITEARLALAAGAADDATLREAAEAAVAGNLKNLVHAMRNTGGKTTSFKGADAKVDRNVAF